MKSLLFYFLIIAQIVCLSLNAQDNGNKSRIEGNGNVVTKNLPVQSFDKIEVSGVFSLYLIQGSKEEVKIEADENLQQYFEVKNEGTKLSITTKKDLNIHSKKKILVSVTFKSLKSMDLKTVGDISSGENMNFDDLKIGNKSVGSVDLKLTAQSLNVENKSVGDIKLSGKADNAVIINKSVGSLHAGSFVVQKMDIDNNGIGSAEVNAQIELKVKDNFLGKVTNKGAAEPKRTSKVKI